MGVGGARPMYLPNSAEVYNWAPGKERVPVLHPVLDAVKAQHSDNFGWAMACCARHRDIAEDVLQEAYLRVLDGRAVFSGKSSHRTWFFAVIKRVAVDVLRTHQRHNKLNLHIAATDPCPVEENHANGLLSQDESISRDQSVRQLQNALMQISVRQREVLHLVFYAELTLEDVAEILHISLGSARTHYQRGKERLAQLLERE